ncbi:MAG TPA: hypothetical protein VIY49_26490 [Bryobacteraceae bacterium]
MKSLGGEKALQAALEKRVEKVVRESDPKEPATEAIGLVCGIALDRFEHAAESEQGGVAQKAAWIMADFELQRGSFESSAALYERLLAVKPTEPDELFVAEYQRRIEILESVLRQEQALAGHAFGCADCESLAS